MNKLPEEAAAEGVEGQGLKPCSSCGGEGWTPGYTSEPACCMGSSWECGAQGCTGPVAMQVETQEQCPDCNGAGTILETDNG